MSAYITITMTFGSASFDVQVDCRQKIEAVAKVFEQKGSASFEDVCFYRSRMQNRTVSAFNTFEEEGIFTGDELVAIKQTEHGEQNKDSGE